MSYCINPSCSHPKNPNNVAKCQTCGGKLRLHGRYQTLGLLGKGGFGATFAAADVGLPGTPICVVKQLRPQTDDPNVFKMAKELFEREAHTLGKIGNHPHVPRLLDYFEDSREFYLVQEYVKGYNLYQEVKKNGVFSEGSVKNFLSEILPILDYIHAQQVIHRDIKPANLIRRQPDQKLILIDFGAVKNQIDSVVAANTSGQTALTAFAVGTAGFAPPEQMAMRPVYASDIYALGVTCVYLLTAKPPKEIDCNHQTGEMGWQKYVTVSSKFAEVIRKMLELSVRHRYKSAKQVLDALNMLPYEDEMMQSMVSKAFATPPSPMTTSGKLASTELRFPERKPLKMRGIRPGTKREPTTEINFSPGTSQFNAGIVAKASTDCADSQLNQRGESPSPTPQGKESSGPVAGNVGFNIATKRRDRRRDRGNDALVVPEGVTIWNSQKLLGEYEQGKRDFTDQDLSGISLAKCFIPGINCYHSILRNVDFRQSELSRANFGKANLQEAVLKDANLSDAYFGYADLSGADLRGANIDGANFKYANVHGVNFCGVDLSSAMITMEQLKRAKTNWRTVLPPGRRRR